MLAIWKFAHVLTAAVYFAVWGLMVRMEKFEKCWRDTSVLYWTIRYFFVLSTSCHIFSECLPQALCWRSPSVLPCFLFQKLRLKSTELQVTSMRTSDSMRTSRKCWAFRIVWAEKVHRRSWHQVNARTPLSQGYLLLIDHYCRWPRRDWNFGKIGVLSETFAGVVQREF